MNLILWFCFKLLIAAKTEHLEGYYSGRQKNAFLTQPKRINPDKGDFEEILEYYHSNDDTILYLHLPLPLITNLTLELKPSRNFMAPMMTIERVTNGKRSMRRRRSINDSKSSHCHYQGHVKNQTGSFAAISLCKGGMIGVVYTENHNEFWIEPLKDKTARNTHHLVFKRASAIASAKRKRKRKKRRHEKNCGTREPKRVPVEKKGKPRLSRSISRPQFVEALVVADTSVVRFHETTGDELGDVEKYLLTIMNMVSSLYRDPSIGNQINIVVVEMKLLEEELDPAELNITVNADKTLESFCKWQEQENYEEDHPLHHDVAILVTRQDICARHDTPCGTLGVAHVGGMCQKERSCNVNEDNGITLAHTISHELGHNFGMYHDTEKVGCSRTQYVMSPSFEADTVAVAWSSCSKRDITNFLDQGHGHCLADKLESDLQQDMLPPGALYDAENQCRLQFGSKVEGICSPDEICSRLWCMVDGVCTSMLKPAAPGTNCGKHKWCSKQRCEPMEKKPEPIDGGWSTWGEWSACSRTCGAGVSVQERHCNQSIPQFGGKFCIGERRKYKICNTQPCPDNGISFRALQCSKFDNETFQGKVYEWLPYFDKNDPCELYCTDLDDTMIVPWGNYALDGTPCRPGTRDVCIGGICKKVGCDWEVDSDAEEDLCGICRGTGDQCEVISGVFDLESGTDYIKIITIPADARNIFIEELTPSKNYIGIGSEHSEHFYLNGNSEITMAGEYQIAGTVGFYERENETERIRIPGPLEENITVYGIFRGKFKNGGIFYNYTLAKKNWFEVTDYNWDWSEWSPCSATCGFGTQISQPICRQNGVTNEIEARQNKIASDKMCPGVRPNRKERVCYQQPCPLPTRWAIGDWQPCPQTCTFDPNDEIFRTRTVLCVKRSAQIHRPTNEIEYLQINDHKLVALSDSDCEGQPKPKEIEPCLGLPSCVHQLEPDYEFDVGIDELSAKWRPDTTTKAPRKLRKHRKKQGKKRRQKFEKLHVFLKKNPGHEKINKTNLSQSKYKL